MPPTSRHLQPGGARSWRAPTPFVIGGRCRPCKERARTGEASRLARPPNGRPKWGGRALDADLPPAAPLGSPAAFLAQDLLAQADLRRGDFDQLVVLDVL